MGEQTGTAVMLVDPDGTPRQNNRVFPFGEPWLSFVASNNTEKFTTYHRDDANGEAGLDYAMARYYGSRNGRFLTPDPGHIGANLSNPQTWNAYAYSSNDPINFTDPSGLCYVDANGQLAEDAGTPCWMAIIGPSDTVTVIGDPYWEPCSDLETGQPTGRCPGMGDVLPGGIPPETTANGGSGGSGGGGAGASSKVTQPKETFLACVQRNGENASLQSIVRNITGGRIGNGWISGALLSNTAADIIGIGRGLFSEPATSTLGRTLQTASGEAAVWEGISHVAKNITFTSTPPPFYMGSTFVQLDTATFRIAAKSWSKAISKALAPLAIVKGPLDLTVTIMSAIGCSSAPLF